MATSKQTSKEINEKVKELQSEIKRIASNNDYISDKVLSHLLNEITKLVEESKKY